jgi:hypothetical protein
MARARRSWIKRCDVRLSPRSYHAPLRWNWRANATFSDRAEYRERSRRPGLLPVEAPTNLALARATEEPETTAQTTAVETAAFLGVRGTTLCAL